MDKAPDAVRLLSASVVRQDREFAAFVGAKPGSAMDGGAGRKICGFLCGLSAKGPPPFAGLRRAFTRPARRLTERQRRIRGLDVQVSPEMSRVFERLPATERELAAAKQREESEYMR